MITKQDIQKLAELARIKVADAEAESLAKDAESILGYVFDVGEVSAAGQGDAHTVLTNVLREDGEPNETGAYTERILAGAPNRDGDYIAVRKVIQK
jgi:aspartyl-tRNA(Asn)/glutamyl-tRNA(Gln) amidotransferase subunit C